MLITCLTAVEFSESTIPAQPDVEDPSHSVFNEITQSTGGSVSKEPDFPISRSVIQFVNQFVFKCTAAFWIYDQNVSWRWSQDEQQSCHAERE